MKKYRVKISWMEPNEDSVVVEAENEDEAVDLATDQIGACDPWELESCELIGEVESPEKPYDDPNQIKMDV